MCEGIFRVFVDYNINKDNSSVDVKSHFHGEAMTVSWFPAQEHSGWYGQRKKPSNWKLDISDAIEEDLEK